MYSHWLLCAFAQIGENMPTHSGTEAKGRETQKGAWSARWVQRGTLCLVLGKDFS